MIDLTIYNINYAIVIILTNYSLIENIENHGKYGYEIYAKEVAKSYKLSPDQWEMLKNYYEINEIYSNLL